MNKLEQLKNYVLISEEADKLAESDLTQIRSNSYYSLNHVKMMEDIAVKLHFTTKELDNTSKVIRAAIEFLFKEIEDGNIDYMPKQEVEKTPKLKNCKMTKSMIAKCKRFAKFFQVSNGQFRRDAIELYHDAVMKDKIKMYPEPEEFLANIRNNEAEYGKE